MPRFSKKHYDAIAAALAMSFPPCREVPWSQIEAETAVWWSVTRTLALMFERDNPRFDHDRFMRACEQVHLA